MKNVYDQIDFSMEWRLSSFIETKTFEIEMSKYIQARKICIEVEI